MVRFIIGSNAMTGGSIGVIYIPIWLDLLLKGAYKQPKGHANLHSNMVRFIITRDDIGIHFYFKFTFQYG